MNLFKKTILLSYVSIASTESAVLTPAFPQIQTAFHLNNGALSSLMTLFLLGYVLCQLAFGPLANRFGRLNCLRIGFAINLLGLALGFIAGLTHHYDLLLASRFITALGGAVGLSGTFTLIHELMDENEAKGALSFLVLSFMLGIGLGVFVGGVLTQSFGWLSIFEVMLIYGALMLVSTFLFQEPTLTRQKISIASLLNGYKLCLKNKALRGYAFILGYTSVVSYAYSTAAPFISAHNLHLNSSEYGRCNLIIMFGMLAGSLHGKRLIAKLGMQKVLTIGLLGLTLCTLVLMGVFAVSFENTWIFFGVAMLLYYFGGLLFPAASGLAMKDAADRGSSSGMMNFINLMTAAISLIMLGYFPFGMTWNFLAILSLGAALSWVVLWLRCKSKILP
jgi:DHA1 family bicyclomycin/chloramphenicol resistance-like MFS transporter